MPFITEEIWQLLDERKEGESISTSSFPKFDNKLIDKKAEEEIYFVQEVVSAIRNIRGEMNLPPSKQINVFLKTEKVTEEQVRYIKSLVRINVLKFDVNISKPKASASAVVKGCDIFIPFEGLIDINVERGRIEKEIARLASSLEGVKKKLSNEGFVAKAPAEILERERTKLADREKSLDKLKTILNDLE
jgi:valyl-tRNA synthetase